MSSVPNTYKFPVVFQIITKAPISQGELRSIKDGMAEHLNALLATNDSVQDYVQERTESYVECVNIVPAPPLNR